MRVPSHHCRLFSVSKWQSGKNPLTSLLSSTMHLSGLYVRYISLFILELSQCTGQWLKMIKVYYPKKEMKQFVFKERVRFFFTKVTISNGYRLGTDSDEELWYHICMYFSWQCMHYVGESETYFWSRSCWWRPTLSLLVSMEATIGILIQTLQ